LVFGLGKSGDGPLSKTKDQSPKTEFIIATGDAWPERGLTASVFSPALSTRAIQAARGVRKKKEVRRIPLLTSDF
jgi:hypothetical protein